MGSTVALVIGATDVELWGLTSQARIERQARSIDDLEVAANVDDARSAESVLVLRADYLFELRTLTGLLRVRGVLVKDGVAAAAHVDAGDLDAGVAALDGVPHGLPVCHVEDLDAFEGDLRKVEPPLVERITAQARHALESRLYGVSYKGITDFVTKWWWPRPARVGVGICARLGITPNAVTLTGVALMFVALYLFSIGQYAIGLALGWFMTYLDTVDGKLARVTVQSSKIGHVLDHGMDIVHPPFWYWAWASSLVGFEPVWGLNANDLVVWTFVGYIAGRLIEAAFHALGEISLFAWRPFDAYFRLIVARRNPCLILLTVAWAFGQPAWGLVWVAGWTVLSSVLLIGRLGIAVGARLRSGPLTSWLAEADAATRYPRAYPTFAGTRRAYDAK